MYAFGRVMRRLIAEHGVTQADVSRATGINKQNISLMCNGKTQYPSIHACKLIATYFGLTLDESVGQVRPRAHGAPTCANVPRRVRRGARMRPLGTRLGRTT